MKKFIYASLLGIFVMSAQVSTAQRVEVKSGDVAVLSGQKNINIEYDYSQFGVGKFATEQEYLDKKSAEYNAKEAGRGDNWKKAWVADRKARFEPKFEELFNKGMEDKGIQVVQARPDAQYTMIVRTTFVEPGFNVGVMRKNAYIDYTIDVVESANKSNKVAEIGMRNIPGSMAMGMDFDTGARLAESYAKAGKTLANFLDKKLK
ncbi:hypothetical protein [Dyadobacter luticola]|uniref:DUF4468 domain-containing protein n=1 Tax=Dyadobacter luticola TaxID=1979387 RepID=A0A5R9L192_9BACT|nr:hypothetical protein [Dyadobacter luticola]TLV02322.1 hypothetical protein FEN17_01390 [Dyadobacter luticola]